MKIIVTGANGFIGKEIISKLSQKYEIFAISRKPVNLVKDYCLIQDLFREETIETLKEFGINYEIDIVSAHRTPEKMVEYGKNAHKRGLSVIIAAAGGAAHLPGMIASLTPLPVIGAPIKSSNSIDGWDSILSILQMPSGVPVATVALNGAKNAAILAGKILGSQDKDILEKMIQYQELLKDKVLKSSEQVNDLVE